jgi:hypothetical protein
MDPRVKPAGDGAVCARSWHGSLVDGFVVRKEIKDHGTERKIDGNFKPDSNVILFDDVTTKGGSVMQAPCRSGDVRRQLSQLNNRGVIVFELVDSRRDRPPAHQVSRTNNGAENNGTRGGPRTAVGCQRP